jgi:2-polyprenyl-3-methyl-5-hydroxy-6-metoxy-1,4-benzoquinol methylase
VSEHAPTANSGAYPKSFVPDLRRLRPWPSLRDSVWRHPDLVELTYGELARLVQARVGQRPRRVLDIGSGLGSIALELARAGHDVTGVDADAESVALARRAAHRQSVGGQPIRLTYRIGAFPDLIEDDTYDCIVFSRSLHHIEDPAVALTTAASLLRPGGRVVCVDFAHDRLGRSGAQWLAQQRMRLASNGHWPESVASTAAQETETVLREWRNDHEAEGLHPLAAMLDPLRQQFDVGRLTWHPYLYWDLAADMRVPRNEEAERGRELRDDEVAMLARRALRGVLFAATGRLRHE